MSNVYHAYHVDRRYFLKKNIKKYKMERNFMKNIEYILNSNN